MWQDAAKQDALTGLSNRRAFMPLLEREHQRALRTVRAYTLAAVDLDHFKCVNDTYGHAVGDAVTRMGGEEFSILLRDCSAHDAAAVLERLRACLVGARKSQ